MQVKLIVLAILLALAGTSHAAVCDVTDTASFSSSLSSVNECIGGLTSTVTSACGGGDLSGCTDAVCSAIKVLLRCFSSSAGNCWSAAMRSVVDSAAAAYQSLDCGDLNNRYRVVLTYPLPSNFKSFTSQQSIAFCEKIAQNLGYDSTDATDYCADTSQYTITIITTTRRSTKSAVVTFNVEDYIPPTIDDATDSITVSYTDDTDAVASDSLAAESSVSVDSSATSLVLSSILLLASLAVALLF